MKVQDLVAQDVYYEILAQKGKHNPALFSYVAYITLQMSFRVLVLSEREMRGYDNEYLNS